MRTARSLGPNMRKSFADLRCEREGLQAQMTTCNSPKEEFQPSLCVSLGA